MVLIFIIGARRKILFFLLSHRGKYRLNTTVMILIFILIILLVNFGGLLKRIRMDTTSTGEFTLSPQTRMVVEKISSPIEALCFFPGSPHFIARKKEAKHLLEEYGYLNSAVTFKFIDPEIRPAAARQYRVRQNGTIVFTDGERQKAVTRISELSFTNALLQVMGIGTKKIFFLIGHGERDTFSSEEDGFGFVRAGLARDLYEVKVLNLAETGTVPDDCAVLVIAGPTAAIPDNTIGAIRKYLKNFGKLLLLADPGKGDPTRGLLAEWGLTVSRATVVETASYVTPHQTTPAVFRSNYPPVIMTRGLDTTYFPGAAPILLTDELSRLVTAATASEKNKAAWPVTAVEQNNLVILPALISSRNSRAEFKEGQKEGAKAGLRGPLAMGAMVVAGGTLTDDIAERSGEGTLTRMVIFGDSDFAANVHIQNGGNGDLFLNAVNWLAEEEHLISIRPKQTAFPRLLLSRSASRFVRVSSVALLPLLIILLGGIVWWRRR